VSERADPIDPDAEPSVRKKKNETGEKSFLPADAGATNTAPSAASARPLRTIDRFMFNAPRVLGLVRLAVCVGNVTYQALGSYSEELTTCM
jgi:hypothetical protein